MDATARPGPDGRTPAWRTCPCSGNFTDGLLVNNSYVGTGVARCRVAASASVLNWSGGPPKPRLWHGALSHLAPSLQIRIPHNGGIIMWTVMFCAVALAAMRRT